LDGRRTTAGRPNALYDHAAYTTITRTLLWKAKALKVYYSRALLTARTRNWMRLEIFAKRDDKTREMPAQSPFVGRRVE